MHLGIIFTVDDSYVIYNVFNRRGTLILQNQSFIFFL